MATNRAEGGLGEEEDPFTTLERTNWQKGFEAYDIGFGPLTRRVIPTLLEQSGFPPPSQQQREEGEGEENKTTVKEFKLLDVATGPGYVLEEALTLAEKAQATTSTTTTLYDYRYTAFDISINFLNLARSNLLLKQGGAENIEFVEGDASKQFPFEDNTFDCITCNFGILHLSNPDSFLRECYRILKPAGTGKLAFSVWASPPQTEGFDLILNAIESGGGNLAELSDSLPEGPPFFRFASQEESSRSMKNAGFNDISFTLLDTLEWESIENSEQLYNIFLEGTARTRELLVRQTPTQTVAIKEELQRAWVEKTNNGSRLLKMPVVVVSGSKK